MVICDIGTGGLPDRLLHSARSAHDAVQIIGAFLIGHIILIIGRKHGNEFTDTCHRSHPLLPVKSTRPDSSLWNAADAVSHLSLLISVKCIRRVYKKLCLLAFHECKISQCRYKCKSAAACSEDWL